jgi:hypothetical protein
VIAAFGRAFARSLAAAHAEKIWKTAEIRAFDGCGKKLS